jgi:hypothetical protein
MHRVDTIVWGFSLKLFNRTSDVHQKLFEQINQSRTTFCQLCRVSGVSCSDESKRLALDVSHQNFILEIIWPTVIVIFHCYFYQQLLMESHNFFLVIPFC